LNPRTDLAIGLSNSSVTKTINQKTLGMVSQKLKNKTSPQPYSNYNCSLSSGSHDDLVSKVTGNGLSFQ